MTKDKEDMDGTVVESDSNASEQKQKPTSKFVVELPSNMKSEIERALDDHGVGTKTDVEAIVQSSLTKWTITLQ